MSVAVEGVVLMWCASVNAERVYRMKAGGPSDNHVRG